MRDPGGELRRLMESDAPVMAPLCLEPLVGRLIEESGFPAAYVGGGALGFSLALSEALLTINDFAYVTRRVVQRVNIPVIVDGTVGFGDAIHTVRAMWELESAGAAAVEFGDQIAPKRAHHHKGVDHLVEPEVFAGKIEEAVRARQDPGFVVIARTGAARWENIDAAVERGHLYAEAGADALLLADVEPEDWPRVRNEFNVPLVLMGQQTRTEAADMGAALVLDASTLQLASLQAMKDVLDGAQRGERQDYNALRPFRDETSGIQELYDIESRTTERELYS